MKLVRICGAVAVALLATACATMDKSECRNADWRTIGLEDGAAGRPLNYIGNHRKACAEHDVTPDLALYEQGHAQGVGRYCTPENGFRQGRAGRAYNGICPAEQREAFVDAHAIGHRLYDLDREIRRLRRDTEQMKTDHAEMTERRDNIEALLIAGGLSVRDRMTLLEEFRQLQSDIALLETDMRDFELEAARLQGEYEVLDDSHGF